MLLIVTCSTTAIFFKSVFQCRPISHFVRCPRPFFLWIHTNYTQWNRLSPGTCDSNELTLAIAYFHSSIIASSDFAFTLMPIFVVSLKRLSNTSRRLTSPGLAPSNGSLHQNISMQPDGPRSNVSIRPDVPKYHCYTNNVLPIVQALQPSCGFHFSRNWLAKLTSFVRNATHLHPTTYCTQISLLTLPQTQQLNSQFYPQSSLASA